MEANPYPSLTCVLFDMDGTLVDTTDLIAEGLAGTLEGHLGHRPPRDEVVALIGRPLVEQLREYVEEHHVSPLAEKFMVFYEDRRAEMEIPFPGAFQMLHEARRLGRKVGLVTSKNRRELAGTLELLKMEPLIDFAITSEDAERPKPAPDPVLEALRRTGAEPLEALFIGDSIYDMRSGRDAGVRTGGAIWGPFGRAILEAEKPSYLFETPADVVSFLQNEANASR